MMDPAFKRTQEKLWLGGLLWWSLLLQLVYGGNNLCVCDHRPNRIYSIGFVKLESVTVLPPHLKMVKLTIYDSKHHS